MGTQEGGLKAAATNKRLYGPNFYGQIGQKGGKISRGGGFAVNRELAVEAGRKGGLMSKGKTMKYLRSENGRNVYLDRISNTEVSYEVMD